MMMKLEHYFKELSNEKDLAKRILVYKTLERENGFEFLKNAASTNRFLHQHLASLLSCILADVVKSNEESLHLLLSIVSSIYINADTISECSIDNFVATEFLKKLPKVLSTSKSNDLIQKILTIIGLQCFQRSAVDEVIGLILPSISVSNTLSDQAIIVVINKFLEQCPESMQLHTHVSVWLKLLLHLTSHSDIFIREKAVTTLKQNLPIILRNKSKVVATCATFLKEEVLPNLNSLNGKENILNEILTLQLPMFMKIIGEDYKRSSRLSNSLLKFVEKGFCQSEERIKLSAFKSWECLIECFAQNKDLLASTKYFNLFTQPLRIKLKTEAITKALVETMWKLAQSLDDNLPDLFEMLCVPLFGTCFKGTTGVMQQRRSSGRPSFSKQQSPYTSIRIYGAEMLSHLLLPSSVQTYNFQLGPLREPFLGKSAIFARFHTTLIPAVKDVICQLHQELSADFLLNIWNHTLKCVQDAVTRKREADIFRSLYQAVFNIVSVDVNPHLLLTIVSSLTSFPNKILNSSLHYQSESASGSMHGTPIVSILNLLFSANVQRGNLQNIKFLECAQRVIAIGMERRIGNLEFIRSVVNQLPTCDAVFLTIWRFLAEQIVAYLEMTRNVNDGDSLEHDFSSLYQALLFPFHFIFNSGMVLEKSVSSPAELTWAKLFERFTNCTSAMSSTRKNEAREYIAAQFLEKLISHKLEHHHASFSFIGRILLEILSGADYSNEQAITKKSHRRKKQNEAVETSLLTGFSLTAGKLIDAVEAFFIDSSLFPPFNILSSIDVIISNVSQPLVTSFLIRVSNILFEYMVDMTRLNAEQMETLEKTWSNILLRLDFAQTPFDDDFVGQLFAVAFTDSRLYKSTLDFWNMKVPVDFEISNLPGVLRDVISSVLKREGFHVTWEDSTPDEALNLNVSAASERSDNANDEKISSNSVVAESDVSIASSMSSEVTAEDITEDISDISQDEKSNDLIEDDVTEGENDDVISDTTQDDCDNASNDKAKQDDDLSEDIQDDDITQLEKAYLSSDDETDISSRSLNLRSFSCARSKKMELLNAQSAKARCRRSPRLIGGKSSQLELLPSDKKRKQPRGAPLVNTDRNNLNVLQASAGKEVIGVSCSKVVSQSVSKSTVDQISPEQDCISIEEKVLSAFDESFHTCRDASSQSIYDLVEMKNTSVGMEDFTIDSSLEQSNVSCNEYKKSKRNCEKIINVDSKIAVVSIDSDSSDHNVFDKSRTVGEVAKISTLPDSSAKETRDVAKRLLNHTNGIIEISTDDDEYEDVEMQEMSIYSEPIQKNARDTLKSCSPVKHTAPDCSQSFEKDNDSEETEEYDYVAVQDMSVCPEPNELEDKVGFRSGELDESAVTNSNDSVVSNSNELPSGSAVSDHALSAANQNGLSLSDHTSFAVSHFHDSVISSSNNSVVSSHDDSTVSRQQDSSKTLEKDQVTEGATIQPSKPASDCDSSAYELVEMKEISVNVEPLYVGSITPNVSLSSSFLSSKAQEQSTKMSSHVQNSYLRETDLSRENDSVIENSQVCDDRQVVAATKSSPSTRKPDANLKVLRDESFNTFVRDLEVEPLNNSFETSDCETNRNLVADEKNKLASNGDVIENSEPLCKSSELPAPKTCHNTPLVVPGSKKVSTPIKVKQLRRIRQCKKKNLEAKVVSEINVSSTHFADAPDYYDSNDADRSVIDSDDALEKDEAQSHIEKANAEPDTDDVIKSNDKTPNEVYSVTEKASSPISQQNVATLNSAVVSPPASERKEEENATPKSRLGKRLLCASEDKRISPAGSPCGILKKPASDGLSPATKMRRVSFAEPISTSTICPPSDNEFRSPLSSPSHLKKLRSRRSPGRVVSRRLSLPLPHWPYESTSPRSVRSVQIAAAIADIKSRNGDANSNTSSSSATSSKTAQFDLESITLPQLYDLNFLKALTAQQLHSVLDILVNANPVIYSLLISKLKES